MYHISDGDSKSTIDKHLNIGKGNFDFKSIFQLIPETAFMSVETYKASKENLDDFVEDIKTLKLFI